MTDEIRAGREMGMQFLARYRENPKAMKSFAPGYSGTDECALCNAATGDEFNVNRGEGDDGK